MSWYLEIILFVKAIKMNSFFIKKQIKQIRIDHTVHFLIKN